VAKNLELSELLTAKLTVKKIVELIELAKPKEIRKFVIIA